MKILRFLLLALLSALVSAAVLEGDEELEIGEEEQLEIGEEELERRFLHAMAHIERVKFAPFSSLPYNELMKTITEVNLLCELCETTKLLTSPEIVDELIDLLTIVVDEIVPDFAQINASAKDSQVLYEPLADVLFSPSNMEFVYSSINLVNLGERRGQNWHIDSKILMKASKLLYANFRIPEKFGEELILRYFNVQLEICKRVNESQFFELMNFFADTFDVKKSIVPWDLFSNRLEADSNEQIRVDFLHRILDKIGQVVEADNFENHSVGFFDFYCHQLPLRVLVNYSSYDSLVERAFKILRRIPAHVFDHESVFIRVRFVAFDRVDKEFEVFSKLLIDPSFAKLISSKFDSISEVHFDLLERVVTFCASKYHENIEEIVQSFDQPYQDFFRANMKKHSATIDLRRRFSHELTGQNLDEDIQLLLDLFSGINLRNYTAHWIFEIGNKLGRISATYALVNDPNSRLAASLCYLFLFKYFKNFKESAIQNTINFWNLCGKFEVPEKWKKQFNHILEQAIPEMAKYIMAENINVSRANSLNFRNLLMKFAEEMVIDFDAFLAL